MCNGEMIVVPQKLTRLAVNKTYDKVRIYAKKNS